MHQIYNKDWIKHPRYRVLWFPESIVIAAVFDGPLGKKIEWVTNYKV